ncbi:alkene reductase [Methylophaga pinxianii]|uniref:alkene reductase n=1 Tax=Methylophaga pinxianii TaxID=2881052 RepID=UPI001CF20410|nr:alkene reductase [Methylophaga pinxianii]MCB2426543.1 alkene reductase [Methylophaga pinxianii]UPH44894.1 alkene reductase [Methylophaga pinxianii]
MSQSQDITLLSPIKIGNQTLKNRLVMAPLTRNRAGEGLLPTEMNVTYYKQRASAGLIISEGTQIAEDALGYPLTPGIHSEDQIVAWRKVTDAVHKEEGLIFVQLWHCGRVSHSSMLPNGMKPLAPSAIKPAGEVYTYEGMKPYETPQAIATADIPKIIEQYRHAACCAVEAGFDGVEIHAANGYLLDQFLRDGSNKRDDQYGGSIENRARLIMEVTAAVCEIWDSKKVGIRLSPLQPFNDLYDSDPKATFSYIVKALNKFDLGYLHITEMGAENPGAAGPSFDISSLRELWNGIYMTNSNYDFASGNKALKEDKADLISFGKLFIANPDLPERFATNSPLNQPDPESFYGGDEKGYIDYPFMK